MAITNGSGTANESASISSSPPPGAPAVETPRPSPLMDCLRGGSNEDRKGKRKIDVDRLLPDLYTPPRVFGTAPVIEVERYRCSSSYVVPRSAPLMPRRLFRLVDEPVEGVETSSHANSRGGADPHCFSKHFFANNEDHHSLPPIQNNDVTSTLAELMDQMGKISRKVNNLSECPCKLCACCNPTSSLSLKCPVLNKRTHAPRPEAIPPVGDVVFDVCINGLEGPHDQQFVPYDPDTMTNILEFQGWFFGEPLSHRITLNIPGGGGVGRGWFTPLLFKEQLLDDRIMNALMCLIASQHSNYGPWDNSWTFLPVAGWGLINPDMNIARELVQPFVDGVQPMGYSLPWMAAERVFGVGNVGGNHWVLYELEMDGRRIVVYDPMSLHMPWPMMHNEFQQMAWNIPRLLNEDANGIRGRRGWEVVRAAHPPQQVNQYDCGILVIEYLNALVTGRGLSTVRPNRSSDDRLRYCGLLYRYAMEYLIRHPNQ